LITAKETGRLQYRDDNVPPFFINNLNLKTMNHIVNMMYLGILAGLFSCFWTRIIRKNMVFRKFGKYLEVVNNRHLIDHVSDSMLVKFIRCCFCVSPWVVFLLSLFYIIVFTPWWLFAVIGVIGGLGAGNFVCEVVNAFRQEEL